MPMQKLLITFFLPSFWPVFGLSASHVQCLVFITCFVASVWQTRQAFVTSCPDLNVCWSSLNLPWSAVLASASWPDNPPPANMSNPTRPRLKVSPHTTALPSLDSVPTAAIKNAYLSYRSQCDRDKPAVASRRHEPGTRP